MVKLKKYNFERQSERTLLADRGGFWIADWHKVPPRPELRKLLGVEMVEVAFNYVDRRKIN